LTIDGQVIFNYGIYLQRHLFVEVGQVDIRNNGLEKIYLDGQGSISDPTTLIVAH